jgi:pimeloyl-ACP methyl ester carboxylesterase
LYETDTLTQPAVHRFPGRDGIELAYRDIGEGPVVALVHGFLSNSAGSWVKYGHAEELVGRGLRVVMPDLRAHGDSDGPRDPGSYPADVLADDGLALIEHLGLGDYDLAGYSLGGRVVLRMLVRGAAPRRAVIAGQGLDSVSGPSRDGAGAMFRRIVANRGGFEASSVEAQMDENLRSAGIDPAPLLHVLDSLVPTPVETLVRVQTRTLVLCGSADTRDGKALAAALPHALYAEIPGDHVTAATNPTRLGAAIADFL